jgi:hypothetical protein
MTPKDKAEELVDKFSFSCRECDNIKQCALIAVDEILNHHYQEQGLYRIDKYYWQQVKKEIEEL